MKLNEIFGVKHDLTLEDLSNELCIKIKDYYYPNDVSLHVLNYSQIDSPSNDPIVKQCRGLIVSKKNKEYDVCCRPFDRFFNYGEHPETQEHIDWGRSSVVEKLDGSLIKIWFNRITSSWEIATRGTAFAESETQLGKFYRSLVLETIGMDEEQFKKMTKIEFDVDFTYLFELIGPDNRIVTPYKKNELVFLAKIHNIRKDVIRICDESLLFGRRAKVYQLNNIDEILKASSELPNMEEGYVVYDQFEQPICKIKSPMYVAVHHIRGEGLNKKRILDLVLTGETEEYLTYFPEDRKHIDPVVESLNKMISDAEQHYKSCKKIKNDRKEIANRIKKFPFSGLIFKAIDNDVKPIVIWHRMDYNRKRRMLESYHYGN